MNLFHNYYIFPASQQEAPSIMTKGYMFFYKLCDVCISEGVYEASTFLVWVCRAQQEYESNFKFIKTTKM